MFDICTMRLLFGNLSFLFFLLFNEPFDVKFYPLNEEVRVQELNTKSRVPTIYMENPEIPVGKSNGMHHSIWNTSEIMGYWSK